MFFLFCVSFIFKLRKHRNYKRLVFSGFFQNDKSDLHTTPQRPTTRAKAFDHVPRVRTYPRTMNMQYSFFKSSDKHLSQIFFSKSIVGNDADASRQAEFEVKFSAIVALLIVAQAWVK